MNVNLHQANGLLIDMLVQMAQHDAEPAFDLVRDLAEELRTLDAATRRAMAQRSPLLADFQFRSEEQWKRFTAPAGKSRPAIWNSSVPRRSVVQLARTVLTLVRLKLEADDPITVCTEFGLTLPVARIISAISLADIDRIAEGQCHWLRPRWEGLPAVWKRLFKAVRSGDPHLLHSCDLHAAQLLAGELMGSL